MGFDMVQFPPSLQLQPSSNNRVVVVWRGTERERGRGKEGKREGGRKGVIPGKERQKAINQAVLR